MAFCGHFVQMLSQVRKIVPDQVSIQTARIEGLGRARAEGVGPRVEGVVARV